MARGVGGWWVSSSERRYHPGGYLRYHQTDRSIKALFMGGLALFITMHGVTLRWGKGKKGRRGQEEGEK